MKVQMLKLVLLIVFVCSGVACFAYPVIQIDDVTYGSGIGFGSILAAALCGSRTGSVPVALLAALFGWIYVVYYVFITLKNNWRTAHRQVF